MATLLTLSFALPARDEILLHSELIEHSRHHEIDEVRDLLRSVIEAGCGGHHDRTRPSQPQHVAEVYGAERSLAWHQNQLALLLERDIRSSLDQRAGRAGGNRRQRTHRARAHDHPGRA